MKAKVQYNDFVGTAAADISDFTNLRNILKEKGIDVNKFNPIGVSYYSSYDDNDPSICFICKDENKNEFYKLYINSFTKNDFFNLFKRLNFNLLFQEYQNEDLSNIKEIDIIS